jgi:hypothetical protein
MTLGAQPLRRNHEGDQLFEVRGLLHLGHSPYRQNIQIIAAHQKSEHSFRI